MITIKKKIIKIVLSSSVGMVAMGLIILVPILLVLDFFGANITDGYVENNGEYAEMYLPIVRKNLKAGNGYVSLDRILYFYLENDQLTFDQIYTDNLDSDLKQLRPISEVCEMNRYKIYSVCDITELEESGQINEVQNKPFNSPLNFDKLSATSYFMQERIVFGEFDIHEAWDFGASNETPVYSVCEGIIDKISFTYSSNTNDTKGGAGNYITIKCDDIDDITYYALYGHLYPNSSTLKVNDRVHSWQQIASVGNTGYSTGSHLHFSVKKGNKPVDGMSLIDFTNTNNNPHFNPNLPDYGF